MVKVGIDSLWQFIAQHFTDNLVTAHTILQVNACRHFVEHSIHICFAIVVQ